MSRPSSCHGLQNTPRPYWADWAVQMRSCSFWRESCRELRIILCWAFLESSSSPCLLSLPSAPPPLHLHSPPPQSQRATAHYRCLTGGSELPQSNTFRSHLKSNFIYIYCCNNKRLYFHCNMLNSLVILFLSLWGVVETNWTFFLCQTKSRAYTEKTTPLTLQQSHFTIENWQTKSLETHPLRCPAFTSLVWSKRDRVKGWTQLGVKRHQKNKANVLNSLRPARVGVEGSVSGVVLKVTVFAEVRANSLAMYKNTKTITSWKTNVNNLQKPENLKILSIILDLDNLVCLLVFEVCYMSTLCILFVYTAWHRATSHLLFYETLIIIWYMQLMSYNTAVYVWQRRMEALTSLSHAVSTFDFLKGENGGSSHSGQTVLIIWDTKENDVTQV